MDIIRSKLKKQAIPSRILLSKFRFPDNADKNNEYAPFFYHLGSKLKPKRLAEFDTKTGIFSACCILNSKDTKVSLFVEGQHCYVDTNIKLAGGKPEIYLGKVAERDLEIIETTWDLIIIKNTNLLDCIWSKVNHNGFICMVEPKQDFYNFCKSKNREPIIFRIKNDAALIQR